VLAIDDHALDFGLGEQHAQAAIDFGPHLRVAALQCRAVPQNL
jgi:hypothetical protein